MEEGMDDAGVIDDLNIAREQGGALNAHLVGHFAAKGVVKTLANLDATDTMEERIGGHVSHLVPIPSLTLEDLNIFAQRSLVNLAHPAVWTLAHLDSVKRRLKKWGKYGRKTQLQIKEGIEMDAISIRIG